MPTDPLSSLRKLKTPERIQDFLDSVPFNHEKRGETCSSPSVSLVRGSMHCFEGALVAAAALSMHGQKPLLMNLYTGPGDQDHAVALFKRDGLWGAISKTNHAVLRYRDPIYRTIRELALSYFHEYYLGESGRKTLRAYSHPLNLSRYKDWMTTNEELWPIAYALRDAKHLPIAPAATLKKTRRATPIERHVFEREEWPRYTKK